MRSQTWFALAALMLVMLVVPSCDQTINYPPPKLTSISPTNINANSPQFILKISGNNLVQQTQVSWITPAGAIPLPQPTFKSINELDQTIPSALIENPGTVDISVTTPSPGGGTSPSSTQPPVVFTINAVSSPTPTVTSLSPTAILAGSGATTVTVTGTNFVSQSTVAVAGANRTTTFVNSTSLNVSLTAADLNTPANLQLTVTNPPPNGGTSNPITLAVKAPIPIISSLSPVSATVGAVATTLSITGTGFINGVTTLTLNGVTVPTSVANGTTATTVLTPAQLLVGGELSAVAMNSGPGGGQSNAIAFSVNPRPLVGLPVLVDLAADGSQAAQGICGGSSGCVSNQPDVLTTDTVGPSTSSTGAWVAFASVSRNLVLADINPNPDVYLRNTCLQTATSVTDCNPTTTVISSDPNGGPANGTSSEPSLSTSSTAPGFAAFTSTATNLTTGVGPSKFKQVFWRPLCTATTTACTFNATTFITEQISVAADGLTPGNGDSYNPVVSADGSYVAFASLATNLVSSVNADGVHPQIYIRSTCNGQTATTSCAAVTYLVSTGDDGVTPGNGNSEHPSISSEGLYVSFTSNSSNLGQSAPNPNGLSEVFEHSTCSTTISSTTNTCAPATFLVSTPDGKTPADGTSYQSSISYTTTATSSSGVPYNGRFVAFASTATTLVPGAGPTQQIYVRDTCTGITTSTVVTTCTPKTYLVSTADGVTPGNAISERPSISGAAEFIAFSSLASNFANTTNGIENIFVRNACFAVDVTCTQSLAIASIPQGTNASPSNGASYVPSISSDGQTVSFLSFSSNLVPNDTNGLEDIFLGSTSFTTVLVAGAKTPEDETAANGSSAASAGDVADNYVLRPR